MGEQQPGWPRADDPDLCTHDPCSPPRQAEMDGHRHREDRTAALRTVVRIPPASASGGRVGAGSSPAPGHPGSGPVTAAVTGPDPGCPGAGLLPAPTRPPEALAGGIRTTVRSAAVLSSL